MTTPQREHIVDYGEDNSASAQGGRGVDTAEEESERESERSEGERKCVKRGGGDGGKSGNIYHARPCS